MLAKDEVRFRAARVLNLSPTERSNQGLPLTLKGIAELVGVSSSTIDKWKGELPQILDEMRADENKRNVQERIEKDKKLRKIAENGLYPDGEKDAVLNALRQLCIERGNAFAGKVWLQAKGEFIEKQETTHILDGSLIAREIIRARQELEDSGMAQVPDEPSILSENLLLSSGQGEDKDS